MTLAIQPQEVPFDSPESVHFLDWSLPVVATPNALHAFGAAAVEKALGNLQWKARTEKGLDHLQVFLRADGRKLWIIDDGQAITALLPEDY